MFFILIGLIVILSVAGVEAQDKDHEILIHPNGNSWVVSDWQKNRHMITRDGIRNWSDPNDRIRTYFRTDQDGEVALRLYVYAYGGTSKIEVTLGEKTKVVELDPEMEYVNAGTFQLPSGGYHFVEMKGVERSDEVFAEVHGIGLTGIGEEEVVYVRDDFYWGQRGPSVHLTYDVPEDRNIQWFYNEITVPAGEDVIGSYFMANGFSEGYFGMQVNSEKERRVLFSVWSPYDTQDPAEIPEEYRIVLNKKGDGVYTGEFGNEGSGGQSYWRYMWRADQTYRFLLKAVPVENNSTDFTAYFYAPEQGAWKLIASFRRPYTRTYIKRPHSFLENFYTQTGYISRKAYYSNQWVCDTSGKWHELTSATFTADATARKGSRKDYAGGVEDGAFYMKNCGFFDEFTPIGSKYNRPPSGKEPGIDLDRLP